LQHRHVYSLAGSSGVAMAQRSQDAYCSMKGG
jgi:hypothetical protein